MFGHGGAGFLGKAAKMMGGPPWAGPFGGHCGPGAILKGANLSDEQVQKVGELAGTAFPAFAHARLDLMSAHKDLFRELGQPEVDRAKILAKGEEIKRQKAAMTDRMVEQLLTLSQILTPEQRAHIRVNRIRQFLGLDEEEEA